MFIIFNHLLCLAVKHLVFCCPDSEDIINLESIWLEENLCKMIVQDESLVLLEYYPFVNLYYTHLQMALKLIDLTWDHKAVFYEKHVLYRHLF